MSPVGFGDQDVPPSTAAHVCPVVLTPGRTQPQRDPSLPPQMSPRPPSPRVTVTAPAGAPCATGTAPPSTTCRVTWAATCTVPMSPQVGWRWDGLCAAFRGGPARCVTPVCPAAVSPPSCQQHSEEVCESCVVKTTLTAENAVEANKLSNNYKVGGHGTGGGTHGCSWAVLVSFLFLPTPPHPKKNVSVQFGFKKWKSHVTARPWEDRSEIVKELYSELNVIRGPGGG